MSLSGKSAFVESFELKIIDDAYCSMANSGKSQILLFRA